MMPPHATYAIRYAERICCSAGHYQAAIAAIAAYLEIRRHYDVYHTPERHTLRWMLVTSLPLMLTTTPPFRYY